jgi:hypothetical protein
MQLYCFLAYLLLAPAIVTAEFFSKTDSSSEALEQWMETCEVWNPFVEWTAYYLDRAFKRECGVIHVGCDIPGPPNEMYPSDCFLYCARIPECVAFSMDVRENAEKGDSYPKGICLPQSDVALRTSHTPGKKYPYWVSGKFSRYIPFG